MNRTEAFVRLLAKKYPSLQPYLAEHINDHFGEVLPHVFFGTVTDWIVSLAITVRTDPHSERELSDVLQLLEEMYASGDEDLQELLCVSFLESLPDFDEPGGNVRAMLGKSLRAELRAIENL